MMLCGIEDTLRKTGDCALASDVPGWAGLKYPGLGLAFGGLGPLKP